METKSRMFTNGTVLLAAAISVFAAGICSNFAIAQPMRSEMKSSRNANLLLRGPVDQVDLVHSRILVLGNWISIANAPLADTVIGDVVAVKGSIKANGSYNISGVTHVSSMMYVPGATQLYIKGPISAVNYAIGTARIGVLTIDYTATLATLKSEDITVGSIVAFDVLRYADTTQLYAVVGNLIPNGANRNQGQTGSGSQTLGQTGSGSQTLGQTGSGSQTLGQTGSGSIVMGQTGSGSRTLGQTGSGRLLVQ